MLTFERQIKQHGWSNPHPVSATRLVIAPLVAGLVGMLVLPPLAALAVCRLSPIPLDYRVLCESPLDRVPRVLSLCALADPPPVMHVYPSIFAAAGVARMAVTAATVLSSWSQSIRDKEFLVEMRLRNYEHEKRKEELAKEKKEKGLEVVGL